MTRLKYFKEVVDGVPYIGFSAGDLNLLVPEVSSPEIIRQALIWGFGLHLDDEGVVKVGDETYFIMSLPELEGIPVTPKRSGEFFYPGKIPYGVEDSYAVESEDGLEFYYEGLGWIDPDTAYDAVVGDNVPYREPYHDPYDNPVSDYLSALSEAIADYGRDVRAFFTEGAPEFHDLFEARDLGVNRIGFRVKDLVRYDNHPVPIPTDPVEEVW